MGSSRVTTDDAVGKGMGGKITAAVKPEVPWYAHSDVVRVGVCDQMETINFLNYINIELIGPDEIGE